MSVAGPQEWQSLKASVESQFGKNFQKKLTKSAAEASCRKLLGVSTDSEVRNHAGFSGTWHPSVETDVNNYIAKLGGTKKFGTHLKRVWKSAGFDDMPEHSAKKPSSAGTDSDLTSEAPPNTMLEQILGAVNGLSARLSAAESQVNGNQIEKTKDS